MRARTALLLLLASCPLAAAERVALVIGNNAYRHAKPLQNAVADARLVARALADIGFETIRLEDATAERMYDGLEQLKNRSGGARVGLVYFAGHGLEVEGRNYLMPVDAELSTAAQLRTQAVALDTVLADLAAARLPAKLAVLDCCRDNPLSRSWLSTRSAGSGLGVVRDQDLPEATMVMFAAGPGQVALDGRGANSPFTTALTARLLTPGQSLFDAFLGTSDDVMAATARRQEPWVKFDGAGRAFRELVFIPGGAAAMTTRTTPNQPPAPTLTPSLPPPPAGMPAAALPPLPASPASSGSVLDQGAVGKAIQVKLPGDVLMKFAYCPPGSFMMGSPTSEADRQDDENQVQVRISKGYWMGQTEVTQGQWAALMGSNTSYFKGSVDLPVENVSWEEAQAFIAKLNQSVPLPAGWRYALPTEAQWEYACRAGTESAFSFGSVLNGTQANCDGNYPYGTSTKGPYLQKTAKVGSYAPNAWGLYDMHGNVWEWCADWYGDKLPGGTDPVGAGQGADRVLRGGSWSSGAAGCRAANRSSDEPGFRVNFLGFRPALVPSR